MARRYTSVERREALNRLRSNQQNYRLTSAETGIPVSTLRVWVHRQGRQTPDPDDVEEVMRYLRAHLISNIKRLVDSLEAEIDNVPLSQRVAALSQLIDRLIKLADKLPGEPGEQVIRIEYEDPDEAALP